MTKCPSRKNDFHEPEQRFSFWADLSADNEKCQMRRRKLSERIKQLQDETNAYYKQELSREVFKLMKILGRFRSVIRHGAGLVSKMIQSK